MDRIMVMGRNLEVMDMIMVMGRNLEVMDMIMVMFSKCACISKGLKLYTLHMYSFLYVKKKVKKGNFVDCLLTHELNTQFLDLPEGSDLIKWSPDVSSCLPSA